MVSVAFAPLGPAEAAGSSGQQTARPVDDVAQHEYPTEKAVVYEDILKACAAVGCEMKSHSYLCSVAHYSEGVKLGGKFTNINCPRCGYNPSEQQWYADLNAHHAKSEESAKEAEQAHNEVGVEEKCWECHDDQLLFCPPLPDFGMKRAGVDDLHLLSLNWFKHLFNYTVHHNLSGQLSGS